MNTQQLLNIFCRDVSEGGKPVTGRQQENNSKRGQGCSTGSPALSSALMRASREKVKPSFQQGRNPYKCKCLLQRVTYTWFSELLPCLPLLESNQPKITLMSKRHI